MKIEIDFAKKNDIPLIKSFIRELADFEKLAHEVIVTEEQLAQSLFSDKPECEVIIARMDEAPVGFALFFHNYSTFLGRKGLYLEDLYVKAESRGRGVGKALLARLAEIATERNCGRLEWWVLDWNKKAISFYESLGAKPMNEWTVFRIAGENLKKLAQY